MSSAGVFPFDSAERTRLIDMSASTTDHAPIPPIGGSTVIDVSGYLWLPQPDGSDNITGWFVHAGVRMAWVPVPELDGVILIQIGGPQSEPGYEDDGVVAFLTRDGLRRFIADLQSIDAQLADKS